ncbi:hypothetical protein [Streptomyces purpureus]|uniref:hypothetical protein n=1 Tax=Streptomyces purpureus TaxID=1951 RepID=UPI00166F7E93|nr:hypothetical protein [Streptomyces purpureus]
MHAYDPSRQPYSSPIPSMRPAHDTSAGAGQSATPIYDALYSEYRRSFRALPGDRSGEEDLGFQGFGSRTGYGYSSASSSSSSYTPYVGRWRPYSSPHTPAALPPAPRRGL